MNRFELPAFLRDVVTRWDVLAFIVVRSGWWCFWARPRGGCSRRSPSWSCRRFRWIPGTSGICRAHDLSHVHGPGASLLFTFTYATLAAKSARRAEVAGAAAGFPAVGADPGLLHLVLFFLQLTPGRVRAPKWRRSS